MNKKDICYALISKINGVQQYFYSAIEKMNSCENNLAIGAIINGKPFHEGEIKKFISTLNGVKGNLNEVSRACYRIIEDIEREEEEARKMMTDDEKDKTSSVD